METLRMSRSMFGGSVQEYMNTLSGFWRGAKQALANSTEVLTRGRW
jgi:hypothetical protein